MAIRTGPNAPLGLLPFGVAHDAVGSVPLGTIVQGYDDVNQRNNEYIWLRSPAGIIAGDDVTYDANFLATEVGAGVGQADAIATSGVNQYAWFLLKPRPVAAA